MEQYSLVNDPNKFQFPARDIWRENGTKQEYAHWWRDSCRKLSFMEAVDFLTFSVKNPSGGRPTVEHYLTAKAADILRTHSTPQGASHTAAKHDALQAVQSILDAGKAPTYVQSLRALADAMELLHESKPKVEFYDRFADSSQLFTIRDAAKIIGIPEKKFIEYLTSNHILFRDAKKDLKPYADIVAAGKMVVKVGESNGHSYNHAKFTAAGIEWISKKFVDKPNVAT